MISLFPDIFWNELDLACRIFIVYGLIGNYTLLDRQYIGVIEFPPSAKGDRHVQKKPNPE